MMSAHRSAALGQTLWIARHGDRLDFEDLRWRRDADRPDDPPLSDGGIQQAKELGQRLVTEGISHIFASPFLRTVQTASHVADIVDLPVRIEHGVCEWLKEDWFPPGGPDYLSPAEMARRFPGVDTEYRSVWEPTYPEMWDEMVARTELTVTLLGRRFPDDMLIIGHGATVLGICESIVNTPPEQPTAPCCGLSKLVRRQDGWHLELQGDRSHLSQPRGNDRFA